MSSHAFLAGSFLTDFKEGGGGESTFFSEGLFLSTLLKSETQMCKWQLAWSRARRPGVIKMGMDVHIIIYLVHFYPILAPKIQGSRHLLGAPKGRPVL